MIYLDIKVVTQPSFSGKRFCLVIVDDFTRWKFAIPLQKKSETFQAVLDWIQVFVTPLDRTVRYVRCDNSKENQHMARVLANRSIATKFSNNYSSASNGIAERAIRSIFGTVRSMLINSNLPHKYWGEASSAATHVLNRMPTTGNPDSKSPYEMLYSKPPNVSDLRTFGATAYVHRHPPECPSSGPGELTALKGIMVGYATCTHGYRILLPDTAVIESASVSFHETTYPGDISDGVSKDYENLTMAEKEEDDTSWTLETENL
jgi:hypothetical protein